MSKCIKCLSNDTEIRREGEHFTKKCHSCGHVGGPYISSQNEKREEEQKQLTDFF